MPSTQLPLYKIGALAVTRAALGVGIGLLLADRLDRRPRTVVAAALIVVGALSTVPLVTSIVKGIDSPAD